MALLKGIVHFAQAMLQNLAEAEQNRRSDSAQDQLIDQLFQIDCERAGSLSGWTQRWPFVADREIALAPTRDVVEFSGVGRGPALGRFVRLHAVREFQMPTRVPPRFNLKCPLKCVRAATVFRFYSR